jgi:hypothetical protein
MDTQTITYRVVCTPDELIGFGRSRGWFFQLMEEKGVLKDRILKLDWVYEQDSITFPMSAQKDKAYGRLDAVRQAGIPIRQVIYGYQIKEASPEPQFKLPENTGEILGKVAFGVISIVAGAAFVFGAAAVMALQVLDPCLIVVLDTGQDEKECPWICLSSWED